MLVVLIVHEAGLRSTLVAQLSLAGASIATARDLDDPMLARSVRKPSVLVIEHSRAVQEPSGWIDGLLAEPRWGKLVLLTGPEGCADPDPRCVYLEGREAPAAIMKAMPGWKAAAMPVG